MSFYSSASGDNATVPGGVRKETEQALISLCRSGGMITPTSHLSTTNLYGHTTGRKKFHAEIIERYMSDRADVGRDGSAAIVTAGPPGAGKSTRVDKLGQDLSGYRRLDADEIKNLLLEQAVADGIFDELLQQHLPDLRPILPNELAVLVHQESGDLHNELVRLSMEDGVNIIVEGTLSWPDLTARYLNWLVTQDYRRLQIINVEVHIDTAKKQASDRWWQGREKYFSDRTASPLGGRFTPPSAIEYVYQTSQSSTTCNTNAVNMYNRAADADTFDRVELHVHDGSTGVSETYSTVMGENVPDRATPLVLGIVKDGDGDPMIKEV